MECSRGIAMGILSVCPSVCQTRALWQNGRKLCLDFYIIERTFILVFWEGEWLVGATPSIWNFGSTGPRWSEIADFKPIIARSASTVRPSEKSSINTNSKSPTRFPTSLRWSSYVAPKSPKGGSKKQNGRFPSIIANLLKKVCYKVSFCENCQRQSCRAFIGLTIHAKIIGGDVPFYLKFWVKVTALKRNRRFSIYFRS